jgi:hypothetical protein
MKSRLYISRPFTLHSKWLTYIAKEIGENYVYTWFRKGETYTPDLLLKADHVLILINDFKLSPGVFSEIKACIHNKIPYTLMYIKEDSLYLITSFELIGNEVIPAYKTLDFYIEDLDKSDCLYTNTTTNLIVKEGIVEIKEEIPTTIHKHAAIHENSFDSRVLLLNL